MKSGTRIFTFVALPKNIITMIGTMKLGDWSFSQRNRTESGHELFCLRFLLNGCCCM